MGIGIHMLISCIGLAIRASIYIGVISILYNFLTSGETFKVILGLFGALAAIWYLFSRSRRRRSARQRLVRELATGQGDYFDTTYAQYSTHFVEQAELYEDVQSKSAKFVEFESYLPAYYEMSRAQRKYYFFWRTQAREGEYLETARSYIFVHIFELINQIGISNTPDGYEQLKRLWLNYRSKYPSLDDCLPDWISDYAVVNQLSVHPLDIYTAAPATFGYAKDYADLLLSSYAERKLDQMPLPLIDALIDHRIEKSKFYQGANIKLLQDALPKVLGEVDSYLRKRGSGIFRRYKPARTVPVYREPFSAAIYVGSQSEIKIADIHPYTTYLPLRKFLTQVVKHTENLLRDQVGHRGRLQVKDLNDEIKAVIASVLPAHTKAVEITIAGDAKSAPSMPIPARAKSKPAHKAKPKPVIDIDYGKIEQLQRDSDEIFERLNLETPVSAVAAEADMAETGAAEEAHEESVTPVVEAPEVHENLIETELNGSVNDSSPVPGLPSEQIEPESSELDEEWLFFAESLSDLHREVLASMIAAEDASSTIDQIARRNAVMPSLLLDTINELAQDAIGDLLINVDIEPPTIEPEYEEMVHHILTLER